jgi:hypothetical protein
MNKVTYFSPNSMIKGTWKLPHLTHINLSDCEFVNDDMIVTIARSCPKLMTVRLNNLKQHKGRGLAALASECDSLSSISICNNINVGDEGVVSLAKFRHIRLRELDLTGCTRITPVGFDFMARYLAHLTFLSLAKTSCRLEQLMKFTCIYRTLQSLDISGCQKMDPKEIANWIWHQKFSQLVDLTLDFSVASRLVKIAENTLVDTRLDGDVIAVRKLVNLTVCELPEKTSLCFLTQLVEQFPRAQVIKLKRGHFESDFLLGYYRTPSPENDYITSTSVNQFNLGQEKVIAIMENVNENRETSFDSW